MCDSGAWQFLEQRRAVVGGHLVEQLDGFLLPHRAQQVFLRVELEVLERLRRDLVRQHAEENHLLVVGQVGDQFRKVGWRPVLENLPQVREVARLDEFLDFRLE